MSFQEKLEKNVWGLIVMVGIVVSIGGIVEIVPLYYLDNTIETLTEEEDSIRPYTALEQEGRDVYVREGCYLCHSQMIRPFRDEKERYGHYSLAAESKYDHPFQWGSKRTGPDLARVGGKYSNEWQRQHLRAPRSLCAVRSIQTSLPRIGLLIFTDRVSHHRLLRSEGPC